MLHLFDPQIKYVRTLKVRGGQSILHGTPFQAGFSLVESIVELVGELVMFSAVSFIHHMSNSAHGAPGVSYSAEQRKEDMKTREDQHILYTQSVNKVIFNSNPKHRRPLPKTSPICHFIFCQWRAMLEKNLIQTIQQEERVNFGI